MVTIKKSYGVRGVDDVITLLKLQELIADYNAQMGGYVGKAIIDTEKITFYKFGLKLGYARFATNGIVLNEEGIIRYVGFDSPILRDRQILTDICVLFGLRCPF